MGTFSHSECQFRNAKLWGQISGKFSWQTCVIVHFPHGIFICNIFVQYIYIILCGLGDSVQPCSSFYLGVLRSSGLHLGAGSV